MQKFRAKKFLKAFCLALAAFFALSLVIVFYYKFAPVNHTFLYAIRASEYRNAALPVVFKREWISIKEMSPNILRAVIAAEDEEFFTHFGFSFKGIERAKELNKQNPSGILHGGSTISQQTAKNVFCTPRRSYIRKAFETYFTILIELIWGKRRILEVYLNVIEMGRGIYGIQAAAKELFGCDAAQLGKKQAAQIAVSLPNPRIFSVEPKRIAKRRDFLLTYMDAIDLSPLALDAE